MNNPPSNPPRGRLFFANPGPTNIPDSILRAMHHATVDFMSEDFLRLYDAGTVGLKRVLGTKQHLFYYTGSGHAAWEASLVNLFSHGDKVLIVESGYFSDHWAKMAEGLGLVVEQVRADWRRGVDLAAVRAALAADTSHSIKGLCVVHNETATGTTLPLPEFRKALDETKHPALFLVDIISSLGSIEFRMDDWGVDCVVGGSQKGLMLPTGLSFTGVSDKAMAAHQSSRLPKHYFNWTLMLTRRHKSFIGTVPISFFYGLQEALRLIDEETLPGVWARHNRLAEATRRAVRHWSGNSGPTLFTTDPTRLSDSVTAVKMPEGHDAEAIRRTAYERFRVSLGGGLGPLGGQVFRIGHLGDLNEPMILGTLAAVEMSLAANNVPHSAGGINAAMRYLTETEPVARAA